MQKEYRSRRLYFLAAILLLSVSCSKKRTPVEYVKFLEDTRNGFRKEVGIEQWKYKVQYKPSGYIYLQEVKDRAKSRHDLARRKSELDSWCFFNLYVEHDSIKNSPIRLLAGNREQYDFLLGYYLNKNRENFTLIIDSQRISASIYNYENSYNLSPQDIFVVGFNVKARTGDGCNNIVLEYEDNLLKTGIVRFVFKHNDLNREPEIEL